MSSRKKLQGRIRKSKPSSKVKEYLPGTLNQEMLETMGTINFAPKVIEAIQAKACVGCFGVNKLYFMDFHMECSGCAIDVSKCLRNTTYKVFCAKICHPCLKGRTGNEAVASILTTLDFVRKQGLTSITFRSYRCKCSTSTSVDEFEDQLLNGSCSRIIQRLGRCDLKRHEALAYR
jgi:hypothetical protein